MLETHLEFTTAHVAGKDEDKQGYGAEKDSHVHAEFSTEGHVRSPDDHEEYGPRSNQGDHEQGRLVNYVKERYILIRLCRMLPGKKQVDDVGHRRWHPPSALVEELRDALWNARVRVRGCRIFHPVSLLEQERAQPAIFSCQ